MRLTLRTLLAYLDNTLEPQDAELLKQKLSQSGFATQLVQRIGDSLKNPQLSAPPPDSVHPIEDPNMMSNYLDSTLSPEQVAEVEKACLESAPHMAEAAACHQILTMVLGKSAEGSERLRKRVMSMVDENGQVMVTDSSIIAGKLGTESSPIAGEIGPRYSDVDLGNADLDVANQPTEVRQESAAEYESGSSVRPVEVGDSGVFKAASKLREQSHQFAEAGPAMDDESMAGSRPLRELEKSDFYEGDVRPSRITPWLVTLALVGVLLFAVGKIFTPLFGPRALVSSDVSGLMDDTETNPSEQDADDIPPMESDELEPMSAADANVPGEQAEPVDGDTDKSMSTTGEDQPESPDDASFEDVDMGSFEAGAPPMPIETGEPSDTKEDDKPADAVAMDPALNGEISTGEANADSGGAAAPDAVIAAMPDKETDAAAIEKVESVPSQDAVEVATVVSEDALVAWQTGDEPWKLAAKDSVVSTLSTLACAPEYRCLLNVYEMPNTKITLVGPTQVSFASGPPEVQLDVNFGRLLVSFTAAGQRLRFGFGERLIALTNESDESMIAIELNHERVLGTDPLVDENHKSSIGFTSIKGTFTIEQAAESKRLNALEQLSLDLDASSISDPVLLEQAPDWVDAEIDNGSLEAEAAVALLELVRADSGNSLTLALRLALEFRRSEVAALAGQSLLTLDDASAYFGVDGLLSKPKQRLYWDSHLDALRSMMNRGIKDAAAVRIAIAGEGETTMDNADGDTLFRLLTGYSQEQLETGGDAELVADLESVSMPVRVLAIEHLRDIVGTTAAFRPEEEVVARRETAIKTWKVRLRKASIRYPTEEKAEATP